MKRRLLSIGVLVAASLGGVAGAQTDTTFTFQGQLELGGTAVNDVADFRVRLFDAATGGNQINGTVDISGVSLTDGLFTLPLDFGSGAFDGSPRWVEIGVGIPSGQGTYTTLSPRQQINGSPFAQVAGSVAGVDGHSLDSPDGNLVDVVSVDNNGAVSTGPLYAPVAVVDAVEAGAVSVDSGSLLLNGGTVQSGGDMQLRPGGVLSMVLDSANGNVAIAATPQGERLFVNGSFRVTGPASLASTTVGGTLSVLGPVTASNAVTLGATTINSSFFRIASFPSLSSGANVIEGSGGRLFRQVSSKRYKDNIQPFETDWSRILDVQPVTYTLKEMPEHRSLGYIAEDFHDLGLRPLVNYDSKGRPDSISYSMLGVYLAEVAKDQQARLEALEDENRRLRDEMDQLRATVAALAGSRR